MAAPLLALLPILGEVLDRVIPDPAQAADAKLRVMELAQRGELQASADEKEVALGQAKINEADAASGDLFRGGWRPFAGWVCGAGFAYTFLVRPLLPWLLTVAGVQNVPPLPPIETEPLLVLLLGLLGLGTQRMFERIRGKA